MNISSERKNILSLVIKICLLPVLIALAIASLGFTNHSAAGNNAFLLPVDYSRFIFPDSRELHRSGLGAGNSFFNSGFKLQIPDSTDEKDSIKLGDSTLIKILSKADSIKLMAKQDSLRRIDSLSQDSTARLKYFRATREDSYLIPFRAKKPSPFFVQPSQAFVSREIKLDSTGTKVIITELVAGKPVRNILEVPLEEYINLRLQAISRDEWEKLGYEYKLKDDKKDLGQFITDITNIDIPLPSSPILSIFGPPNIKIKIAGAVDIHGAWRNEKTEGVTTSALGNVRNEPDFKQQVQINLSGTIGDKLTISADWNTERTFQYENQLKIQYKGYEDEIIQSIEAGNVSLQTSPLVGGSEALFGVKANFMMGPLSLTALASQKKGEVQEVSISGGAKAQTFEIRAYDYSQNHYFLNDVYADEKLKVFETYYSSPVPVVVDSIWVVDLEVWKTTTAISNGTERSANAFINLPRRTRQNLYSNQLRDTTQNSKPGENLINVRFVKLVEDVDYTYHKATGYISFKSQIQDQDGIAVAYRIEGPSKVSKDDDYYYGEFIQDLAADTTSKLVLKLIKPPNLQPSFKKAWKLQLRNIYPVGGRGLKQEGFKLDIKYLFEGREPQSDYNGIKLLEAFGLDKTDASGTSAQPDGEFDFNQKTILPTTGEIIFPMLQPFGKDLPRELPEELRYNAIYDTTITYAKQDRAKDKFIIRGEYSASVSSVYSIGFNVVENSVRVLLNGMELKPGVDYTVDYNLGQVILRKAEALVPGADLKITYEQNDLFQLASKTLLGLRGLYEFNKETQLGFSFLNLNQQTLSDKVRIGEEPMNNSIFGADFKTNINLPFITKALDKVINTSAPSSLSINAEYAYINPDPNTKKSTVASDGGRSIAYIDDFEGAKRIIPLGMSYTSWTDLSVPDTVLKILNIDYRDIMNAMDFKAKSYWFNRTPPDVTVSAIYGDRKKTTPSENQITTLDFVYLPGERGYYNNTPNLGNRSKNWGGMMKALSSNANNLVEENIEFIEFWMYIGKAPQDAVLNIDLGLISEDVIPNGRLDKEDKDDNDRLSEDEDTGLDGLRDPAERNAGVFPDPSNDNFSFNLATQDYSKVNGTEGNGISSERGRIPDTEDLNRNFTLDKVNSYFRYTMPITSDTSKNPFAQPGDGKTGWFLYRIPLKDYIGIVGTPTFSVVSTIRFSVMGANDEIHLRFAEMNLVGNQWQKVLRPNDKFDPVTVDDEVLTISTINVEDNPNYIIPPGIQREKDRTQPDYDILKNEQSLDLRIKNLADGMKREVVRYLPRPLDVFNYKEMKLFIHSDDSYQNSNSVSYYNSPNDYATELYIRFGSDSLNYYEYRQPSQPNLDPHQNNWSEIQIVFEKLTAIKQQRDSSNIKDLYKVPVPGKEGHYYGIRGLPTLTRITYFTIGIVNPRNIGSLTAAYSGSIWINELRVLEANNTPGWAYTATASLALADLLKINVNANQRNPYFHGLAERFGKREDNLTWGLSVDLDVLKILPVNLTGSNLRVNYTRREESTNPIFIPGTDVKVDEAQKQVRTNLLAKNINPTVIEDSVNNLKLLSQTLSVSEMWSFSNIRFKVPTDLWYIRDIINNLSFGFNYNKITGRSPTTASSLSWVWNASASYAVTTSRDLFFRPVDIPLLGDLLSLFTDYKDVKVYFLPQMFNASLAAYRKYNYLLNRSLLTKPNIVRDFTATRGAGFNWALTEGGFLNPTLNYNFDVSSTLAYLLVEKDVERTEAAIWRDIFGGQMFGKDFNYRQNVDLRLNPKLPSYADINRYISLNASYSVSYNWQNDFRQGELGRSAGYANRITASLNIRLKSIFAPLFQEETSKQPLTPQQPQGGRGGRRSQRGTETPRQQEQRQAAVEQQGIKDSLQVKDSLAIKDTSLITEDLLAEQDTTPGTLAATLELLKLGVKWLLLDYDQISINFAQSSTYAGGGLYGEGTGFNNFWGYRQKSSNGPSRLFMLGLTNDIGRRAPRGNLTDNYTHKNDIDLKTSRPLWEGAQLDLTWKVGWGVNKTTQIETDSLGNIRISTPSSTGTVDRSFLTLPNTFVFSMFGNGIKKVSELYNKNSANPNASLSEAFMEGFETFSLLSKIPVLSKLAKYIPRPNWSFNWSGLEKFSFLSWAKRVSLQHIYTSTYSEGWKIKTDGLQEVQSQRVEYGFNPLVGLNFQFDDFLGGQLTSNIRFTTRSSFSLGLSNRNITESFARDINFSATYLKTGFELPLFGISLKNDLEISFTYTSGKTSSTIYDMDNFREEGKPQDGKTNTVIEPRIKYVMSSRVTVSIFYKRTSIETEGQSRILPTTTNEAGVDVRISIQ